MQVYEQMIAMDDFLTFKKLMVKRNVELGYEALKALHKDQVPIIAPESEEEAEAQFQRAVKESEDTTFAEIKESETESQINSSVKGHLFDKELCDAMDQNLMEIVALHKREETIRRCRTDSCHPPRWLPRRLHEEQAQFRCLIDISTFGEQASSFHCIATHPHLFQL